MRIRERCPCGAEEEVEDSDRAEVRHVMNIWRKHHHCTRPIKTPYERLVFILLAGEEGSADELFLDVQDEEGNSINVPSSSVDGQPNHRVLGPLYLKEN